MHYYSPFIKLTLHIRKLNEFLGDSIRGNYRMSWDLKWGKIFNGLTFYPDCT